MRLHASLPTRGAHVHTGNRHHLVERRRVRAGRAATGRGGQTQGAGLPAGPGPPHGRLRELRHQLLRDLRPVRLHDALRIRPRHGRSGRDDVGVGGRRPLRPPRRPRARRGHQRVSDVRGPLLHGRPARRPPLGLVHGLAQPPGPARRDRRNRLRRRPVHRRAAQPPVQLRPDTGIDLPDLPRHPRRARRPEPLRRTPGQRAQLDQRVVAPGGRGRDRGCPRDRARPPPLALLRVHRVRQRHRLAQPAVRRRDRPPPRAVHVLRLRRVRASLGGDVERLGIRRARHRAGRGSRGSPGSCSWPG